MRIGGEISVNGENNFKGGHGEEDGYDRADDESTNGFMIQLVKIYKM